jgi:hypothetical protein
MLKIAISLTCAGLAAALIAIGSTRALAQEWRRGESQYFKEPHKFGALCEHRWAHGGAR